MIDHPAGLNRAGIAEEPGRAEDEIRGHRIAGDGPFDYRTGVFLSIVLSLLGILLIVSGVIVALSGPMPVAIVNLSSGTVAVVLAALFLRYSNEARRLASELQERTSRDRRLTESLRLCESIPDGALQSQLKAQLSLYFAGLPPELVFGMPWKGLQTPKKEASPRTPRARPGAESS